MKTTADILREASRLVDAGWTRQAQARDESGAKVDPLDPRAVCFCAEGAILRARGWPSPTDKWLAPLAPIKMVSNLVGSRVFQWNDYGAEDEGEVATVLALAACLAEES
jgi:hypothetical protein